MAILISATSISFGKQLYNTTTQKIIKIENTGIERVNIFSIVSSNIKFSTIQNPTEIESNSFVNIIVTYSPNSVEIDTGILTINCADTESPHLINLYGEGISPKIVIPQIIDFGKLPYNSDKTLELTIKNNSDVPLTIFNFIFSNTQFFCNKIVPFEINANSQINIQISAHISTVGTISEILTIVSNDFVSPNSEIELKAESLKADIFVIPSKLEYENCSVNSSIKKAIKISNNGQSNLNITVSSNNSEFTVNNSAFIVLPSQSYQIYVTFLPNSIGDKTAIITLQSNDPENPLITILCFGTGSSPKMILPVEELSFGNVCLNNSKKIEFQIKNDGSVKLNVSAESNSGLFVLDKQNLEINPYSSEKLIVSFTPVILNSFSGNLILESNDLSKQFVTIPMSGSGSSLPIVSISQNKINFGTLNYGQSKSISCLIKNIGYEVLNFDSNSTSSVFSSNPKSGSVLPSSQQSLLIKFAPVPDKSLNADLIFSTNDPNQQTLIIKLSGKAEYGSLEWIEFNLDQMVPSSIKTIADKITDISGNISDVLEIMKGILNTIKMFIIDISDPIKILLKAIETLVDNLINDLSATGIYLLASYPGDRRVTYSRVPHVLYDSVIDLTKVNLPQKIKDKYADLIRKREKNVLADDEDKQIAFGTVIEALDSVKGGSRAFFNKVIQSFDDVGDSKRPQFSEDAFVGGVVLVADSGDISKLLNATEKLLKIFNIAFKVQFNPPTNVTSIGGNKQIRLTFSPNDGLMADSYIIWRSPISGGELLDEDITDPAGIKNKVLLRDKDGNPVTKYEIVGVTSTVDQLSKILNVSKSEAENKIVQAGFYVREVISNIGDNISGKFIFDDIKEIVNDKPYYYVISAASIKSDIRSNPSSLIRKTSDQFVFIKSNKTGKIERKIDPHSIGIDVMGPYSTETSASARISFDSVEAGLARCKNYRCMSEKPYSEKSMKIESIKEIKQKLEKRPISSSIQVKLNSGTSEIDIPRKDYTVQDKIITFSKTNYFKIGDVINTKYNYLEFKTNKISNEQHSISNVKPKIVFELKNKPIDSTSLKISGLPKETYKVIDDLNGKVEINTTNISESFLQFSALYDYFKQDDLSASFRCINPEYLKAYFDPVKCNDGTTLCPGYENRNCIWNTGDECTNEGKSKRIRSIYTDIINGRGQLSQISENIPFKEFWDPTYCQNGITAQRCDGYSKIDSRAGLKGTPPDWVSYTILDLVPDLKEVIKLMSDLIESLLSGTEKFGESILNFLNLIEEKINNLQRFIDKINSVLTMITENFSGPGFYLLNIPLNSGGNEYFKRTLLNAKNGPNSDIFGYTAGITILYGGPGGDPSIKAIEKALGMLFG